MSNFTCKKYAQSLATQLASNDWTDVDILAEKLLNFLLLKNEPNLSLLTLHNFKNSNKFILFS